MFKHALILAGGDGRRFGKLTKGRSKPMIEVCERPLISFSLNQLDQLDNLVITVGPFMTEIIEYCYRDHDVKSFVVTKGRGNCWWIFNTYLSEVNAPILVLPCDLITYLDLDFIYSEYNRLGFPALMLVPVQNTAAHTGDYIMSEDFRVSSISSDKISDLFCSGIQVLNPKLIISHLNECSRPENFNDLWKILIEQKLLFSSNVYPHLWYTINSEKELEHYQNHQKSYYAP